MKTVEELEKEIDELETEQADCNFHSVEYNALEEKIQYLYTLLDKAKGKKECINERFY